MFIEMEYIDGGNLEEWIEKECPCEYSLKVVSRNLLKAIEYLHVHNVVREP